VEPFLYESPKGQTTGRVVKDGEELHFEVFYERSEAGYMLVWVLAVEKSKPIQ
jgi:hypothetical protein